MSRQIFTIILCGIFILPSFGQQPEDKNGDWGAYWENSFIVEHGSGIHKLKFGGRIHLDMAFFIQDEDMKNQYGELNNGVEFRRIRLFHEGTVYQRVNYKIDLDFAVGKVTPKDVWIGVGGIKGIGQIKIGHLKEPMRLEVLTSSNYLTFMERSPVVAIIPERNTGLLMQNHHLDGRLTWMAGVFRRSDGSGNQKMAGDELNLTGRLTGLPFYNPEHKRLIHIGGAYSYRHPYAGTYQIASRPESHLAPRTVSTGEISDVDDYSLIQGEMALVMGSFSLQGEVITSMVSTSPFDTILQVTGKKTYTFTAFYIYASYFLTGETRPFKPSSAKFSRVKPRKNFGQGGAGAWEVALRYSAIDLDDEGITGTSMSAVTAGINWYLNPVSRVMFNYVWTDVKDRGQLHTFQTRFQVNF